MISMWGHRKENSTSAIEQQACALLEKRDEIRIGTERIKRALRELGNPENEFPLIMVAGSNGKTSTAYFISQFLEMAGMRTGLFTSPHPENIYNAIVYHGVPISPQDYGRLVLKAENSGVYLTAFELETAAAYLYFREKKVDAAIMEMGMGGKDDAVFVRHPEIAVITSISLEHTNFLGKTVEEITKNKGEIIPYKGKVVTSATGKALKLIKDIAGVRDTQVVRWKGKLKENFAPHLQARYLKEHAALAGMVVREFLDILKWRVPEEDRIVFWSRKLYPPPVRYQRIRCPEFGGELIIDGAHNPQGFKKLFSEIADLHIQASSLTVVVGIFRDKDIGNMAEQTAAVRGKYICTSPLGRRHAEPEQVAEEFRKYHSRVETAESVEVGVRRALEGLKNGVLLITGSLYTAAEALDYLKRRGIIRDGETGYTKELIRDED